jgi:hypothetical protein
MFVFSPSLPPVMSSLLRLRRLPPLRPLSRRNRKLYAIGSLYLCSSKSVREPAAEAPAETSAEPATGEAEQPKEEAVS